MELTKGQHVSFVGGTKRFGMFAESLYRWIASSLLISTTNSSHPIQSTCLSRRGTQKLDLVVDSVWEWVDSCIQESPTQPVANLGLGLGQENPPQFLVDAYKDALDHVGCNQYGPTDGLLRFKETLSRIYSPLYGRTVDPQTEISVHSGGTEAILSTISAFVEPGDEVIVLEPAFDLYELHTRSVGGSVKSVRLHQPLHADTKVTSADDWSLNMEELEAAISPRTRMLVLNNPHNPLGKVFSTTELIKIGNLCVQYGLIILADEVYERLHYTPTFPRIATLSAEIARCTVTIGSIGKAFNATGWRVGYAIGDRDLIKYLKRAHIILSYTTAGPPQIAAAQGLGAAEQNGFWEQNRQDMQRKIAILCSVFDELGLPYVKPSGAHYILLNASKIRIPAGYNFPTGIRHKSRDWRFCYFLIREFGVATIPVSASFSNANAHVAEDYLRFVACKSDAELQLARQRLAGLKPYLA